MSITSVRFFTSAFARGLVVSAFFALAIVAMPHSAFAAGCNHLIISAPFSNPVAGQVSGAFTVNGSDRSSSASSCGLSSSGAAVVTLDDGSANGTFYSDAAGTNAITTLTLSNSGVTTDTTHSATFYYKDSVTGSHTIKATSSFDSTGGTKTFTIDPVMDGAGTMTVSPSSATSGTAGNNFTFHFSNNSGNTFASNSVLTLTIPAGWTAPQESNPANAGYVTIANSNCSTSGSNGPANGTSDISESGNTVTVTITGCANGKSFDIQYNNLTAPAANSYTFTTATRDGSTGSANIAVSPEVTVSAPAPTTGSLTVTTNVVGGSAVASDFPLTLDGMSITSGTATTTSSGSHTVAAGSVANYAATFAGDCNSSGQVTVPAGSSASCTVTETYSAPVIPTGNLIANPSVETPDSGNVPASWTNDYYGDVPTFTYPVAGAPGAGSSAIEVTYGNTPTIESGAYWLFDLVNVAPGHTYFFTDKYKSDVVTTIEATFSYPLASAPSGCDAGGAPADHCFAGQWFADAPATGGAWANLSTVEIPVPAGADAVRVRHILSAKGTLTTDAYSLTSTNPNALSHGFVTLSFDDGWKSQFNFAKPILDALHLPATFYIITGPLGSDLQAPGDGNPDNPDYMTLADITALKNDGMDIGAHTRTHPAGGLTATTTEGVTWEVKGSLQDLADRGFTVNNFAYPEGIVNGSIETAVANAGFTGARGTDDGFNDLSTDHYDLKASEILSSTNIAGIKALVDEAVSTNTWLVLFTHKIAETSCGAETGCMTKADLQDLANYIAGKEAVTPGTAITVSQGLALLGATAPVNQAPILSPIADQNAQVGQQLAFTAAATDANNDTLTYALTGSAPAGASITSAGAFTWTPTADQTGATTTTVTVSDGHGGTASQVVNITVGKPSITVHALNQSMVAGDAEPAYTFWYSGFVGTDATSSIETAPTCAVAGDHTAAGTYAITCAGAADAENLYTFNYVDGTLTVTPFVDTTAPSFDSISAGTPGQNDATVTWTTDEAATGQVYFGTTTDYSATTSLETALATNHSFALSGLSSGTGYHFVVVSTDASGNTATSSDATFTTATPSNNGGGGNSCTGCSCGGCGGGGGGISGSGPLSLGFVNTNPTGGLVLGASTGGLSETQIDAILNLLRSFNADQSVIDNVNSALHGTPGSSTSGKFIFTKTLQVGSTGNEVTQLQSRLTLEGVYSGPITGYFGPLTKAAVIKYQAKYGIDQVGIVGPLTRAELNK